MRTTKADNVDDYIAEFPKATQQLLKEVRKTIVAAAPQAEESISYGMPGYKLYGKPLIYFGGYEKHIGLYATPSGHAAFDKELSKYKQGKGSVQLPIDEKLPLALIKQIVKFRVQEVGEQVKGKVKAK
jgi:uncharacterized protein YdhG (YjbR/CyaY superfamily)